MKTHFLGLDFKDDRKSEIRHAPIATIFVKTESRRTELGPALITPDCVSISEIEFQIEQLIQELESIRKQARAKFRSEDNRFRKAI